MEIKEYVRYRKSEIKERISSFLLPPTLAIVTVGNDPASEAYVRGKKKDAAEVGIAVKHLVFAEDAKEEEVLRELAILNEDPGIHGIIVQLPLPKHISQAKIDETILPSKDVDGFVPNSHFEPCTPKGVVDYLSFRSFPFEGSNAVIFGRSQIVGKPMAKLLLSKNCNVTVLHSKTREEDRAFYIAHADLLIAATGRRHLLDAHYAYKKTAYLMDVGINRDEEGHLHGDADPGLPIAYQSPVPGGVGLLTRLALLENLLEAYEHELSHR